VIINVIWMLVSIVSIMFLLYFLERKINMNKKIKNKVQLDNNSTESKESNINNTQALV